jgi:uncharacterized protein YndB with AHSA1/START domain
MPNTVRLHRVLATKPDNVYRAFIEPDATAKWVPPNGCTSTVQSCRRWARPTGSPARCDWVVHVREASAPPSNDRRPPPKI